VTKHQNQSDNVVKLKAVSKGAKCPLCKKPTADQYRPFCSKRCADLDLGQWLTEGYRISAEENFEDQE